MNAHLKSVVELGPLPPSLVHVLRQAAAERPDAMYVDLIDAANKPREMTFAQVLAGAERWGRWLLKEELARGSRVALLLPTGDDFLFAFFGAQMAGGVPVPCPFPLALGDPSPYVASLSPVLASAEPALFVTVPHLEAAGRNLIAALAPHECRLVLAPEVADPGGSPAFPEIGPEDVALIQYASGRVRAPTGAVLGHRQVLANVCGLGKALGLGPDDVALTWVPLVHDMGLIGGLFTSLSWRCPLHVMPPQLFLMHPYQWLKNISNYKVTLAAAPNAGYQLCVKRTQDRHLKDMDLSRWRLALNGAETVHPSTIKAFCQRFAPVGFRPEAMFATYGIAENTLATACPGPGSGYSTQALPGGAPVSSLGGPLAGQELAVVDERNQMVAEGVEGEVVVRGACVMKAYFNDEAATRRAIDEGGWLHTGDWGFVEKGSLALTGRKKDMVIKMGRNYYPSDVEGLLESFPKSKGPTVAFASPNLVEGTEDLILLVESEPLTPEAHKQLVIEINAELLARLGIRADKVVCLAPGALAASREAAERARLRRDYLEGKLA